MNSGRIKWISSDASHGFILMPDGQEAYFNAYDILEGVDAASLALGEEVSFEVLHTQRGLEAFNIQIFIYA